MWFSVRCVAMKAIVPQDVRQSQHNNRQDDSDFTNKNGLHDVKIMQPILLSLAYHESAKKLWFPNVTT